MEVPTALIEGLSMEELANLSRFSGGSTSLQAKETSNRISGDAVTAADHKPVILLADEITDAIRFIAAFVDQLSFDEWKFMIAEPAETGRPAYDPRAILKLYIYGHLNRIRSTRRLEMECTRNIEVMWLMDKLRPDHNTIARFQKDNDKPFRKVFRVFVRICVEMGLEIEQMEEAGETQILYTDPEARVMPATI